MYIFKQIDNKTVVFSIVDEIGQIDVLIDKEDEEKVKNFPLEWRIKESNETMKVVSYAVSKGKSFSIELSHLLLEVPYSAIVKYKNGVTLDCRKRNLEIEQEKTI